MNFYLVHFTCTAGGVEYDDQTTVLASAAHQAARLVRDELQHECRINTIETLPGGVWKAKNRLHHSINQTGSYARQPIKCMKCKNDCGMPCYQERKRAGEQAKDDTALKRLFERLGIHW